MYILLDVLVVAIVFTCYS